MSIPATEHSVMTCWPSEREAIGNMIDHFGSGLFACVMDSYDYAKVRPEPQVALLCPLLRLGALGVRRFPYMPTCCPGVGYV